MKSALLFVVLTGLAIPVFADPPAATPAPAAMDWNKVIAIYGGSWKTETDNLDTPYSKPGHVSNTNNTDCHLAGEAVTCITSTNGRLNVVYVFARDADGTYKVHSMAATRDPVDATFNLGDDGVVILYDTQDRQKNTVHLRMTRKLTSADTLQTRTEAKKGDDKWFDTAKGMDARIAPAGPAPATAVPALDKLLSIYAGAWTITAENYSSEFSQAGSNTTHLNRGCYRDGDTLKCLVLNGLRVGAELVFTYDAATGGYKEHLIGSGGPLDFTVAIKGDTWTYTSDNKDKDGNLVHWRDTRTYKGDGSVESRREYKKDPGDWITVATETETRTKPTN